MRTQKMFFITTFLALSTALCAQDYAFKVLANKGNNEVKSGATWQPLKTGATLNPGDELKLGDNAYIGLVHNSGKPVEVKEAGIHKVSALEEKVPDGSSVLNKYAEFILSSSSDSRSGRLSATGAVHRGEPSGDAPINLFLPDNDHAGIYNNIAIIHWTSDTKGPYIVTIKNMFEDVVERLETVESSYEVNLNSPKYAQETAILIEISAKADPKLVSKRHLIKRLSPAETDKISTAFAEIKPQISEETALNKLILAGFYENNNLLIDAIYAYQQALRLEPEAYEDSYKAFLERNNLN